jgi:hypothetical protein
MIIYNIRVTVSLLRLYREEIVQCSEFSVQNLFELTTANRLSWPYKPCLAISWFALTQFHTTHTDDAPTCFSVRHVEVGHPVLQIPVRGEEDQLMVSGMLT